jgi:hypothetical protein
MKPTTTVATTASRPNRLLIALAAAWMAISLAIGGTVTADLRAEASGTDTASMSRTAQP